MNAGTITAIATAIPAIIGAVTALIVAIKKPTHNEVNKAVANGISMHQNVDHTVKASDGVIKS